MKTIVHVNQHIIKANAKTGAQVWIETEAEVEINR